MWSRMRSGGSPSVAALSAAMLRWAMRRNSVSLRCLYWLCRHEPRSGQSICKMKPASTTALYSSHRRGERVDIGILVLVGIDDKAGEDSGRGGGHECLGRRGFRYRHGKM